MKKSNISCWITRKDISNAKEKTKSEWKALDVKYFKGRVKSLSTSADGFSFVEEIIDVSAPLMMQPENWPEGLHLPLSLVRLCFS